MRVKKTTFFPYSPYECSAVEEYLEIMAERGWLLESISKPFFKFKRIEPKKLKFSVDILNKISYFDPNDSNDALNYREYCEAAGWKYLCQDKKIQVFYAEDYNSTIDIHTDENEKFKAVFNASIFEVIMQIFLVIVMGFNFYMQVFALDSTYLLTSNVSLVSSLIIGAFVIISTTRTINFFIWVIKARKKLKKNRFMPYNNYKQLKRKNIFTLAWIFIILTTFCVMTFLENRGDMKSGVIIAAVIIPVVLLVGIQCFIKSRKYSKELNIALTIGSIVFYLYLFGTLMTVVIIGGVSRMNESKSSYSNINLRITDLGYEEKKNPKTEYSSSIIAEKIEYFYYEDDGVGFNYDVLKSNNSWVIKFHENRLLNRLRRYGEDLKQTNTDLPSDVKAYSDESKKSYILVSKDKVININKNFEDMNENEFLDIVYEKLISK